MKTLSYSYPKGSRLLDWDSKGHKPYIGSGRVYYTYFDTPVKTSNMTYCEVHWFQIYFFNPNFTVVLKTCVYIYTVSVFLRRNIKTVPEFAFIIQRNSLVNLQEISGIIYSDSCMRKIFVKLWIKKCTLTWFVALGMWSKKTPQIVENNNWFLLHDNAPTHRSVSVKDLWTKNNVTTLEVRPYSLDLAAAYLVPSTEKQHWREGRCICETTIIIKNAAEELKRL